MSKALKNKNKTKVIEHHFEGTASFQELLAFTIKQEIAKILSERVVKNSEVRYNVNQVDMVIADNKGGVVRI